MCFCFRRFTTRSPRKALRECKRPFVRTCARDHMSDHLRKDHCKDLRVLEKQRPPEASRLRTGFVAELFRNSCATLSRRCPGIYKFIYIYTYIYTYLFLITIFIVLSFSYRHIWVFNYLHHVQKRRRRGTSSKTESAPWRKTLQKVFAMVRRRSSAAAATLRKMPVDTRAASVYNYLLLLSLGTS